MKIVLDARELRTSSGRYVERLLHYLQEIDAANKYVVLLKPKDMENWKPISKNFRTLPCPYKEFTFGEQIGMLKQVRALKPDLVHFAFTQQPVLYRGPVVTTVHDLTTARFNNPSKNWFVFKIKRWVYRGVIYVVAHKSKAIITPTEYVKEDLAKYAKINSRKIAVTYESADPLSGKCKSVELPGMRNDKPFIMYVGRPNPHKNLNRLVAAFSVLQKERPDLQLLLVGKEDDNYRKLKRYVKKLGIEGVVFGGFVPDDQLRWLYEKTSAYVFPSLSEGFGLPGLEAMVHGAPLVSSNATCLPEVYGEAAQYFDPLDVNDIAKNIGKVLDSPELRKSLIHKGKLQAAKYSWKKMAEETLAAYERLGNA